MLLCPCYWQEGPAVTKILRTWVLSATTALAAFAKLAPYLSAKGRAGLASFMAEVKALHRKQHAAK